MVFGKTYSQVIEEETAVMDRLKSWHPIFALVPHQITHDGRWVWWQRCERRLSRGEEMWFYRLAAEQKP